MSDSNTGPFGEGETVYATDPSDGQDSSDERDWPDYTDPEWLKYRYHVMNDTQKEMAELVGVSATTIGNWMEKCGIDVRDRSRRASASLGGHDKLWDKEWLREKYENGETTVSIAEMLDVSHQAVNDALDRFGIERRDCSEAKKMVNDDKYGDLLYRDMSWLYHQYWRELKSCREIAEENGWGMKTVHNWLRKHNIQTRSRKASSLLKTKKEMCVPVAEERELVSGDGIDASWADLKDVERGCIVPYRDRKWLKSCVESGFSNIKIANLCGCDVDDSTISRWISRLGIDRPD